MGVAAERTVATSESIEMNDNANMMESLRMQKKEHQGLLPFGTSKKECQKSRFAIESLSRSGIRALPNSDGWKERLRVELVGERSEAANWRFVYKSTYH